MGKKKFMKATDTTRLGNWISVNRESLQSMGVTEIKQQAKMELGLDYVSTQYTRELAEDIGIPLKKKPRRCPKTDTLAADIQILTEIVLDIQNEAGLQVDSRLKDILTRGDQ